jgi:sec-independent protein translocase protein TatA
MSLFAILGLNMEMAIVLLVALLLFGNRLPSVMRSLGQSVTEFKKGMEGTHEDDAEKLAGERTKSLDDQRVNTIVEATKKPDDQPAKG